MMGSLFKLISQTARDLVYLLIPRHGYKNMYAFAFLVHPRDERDMHRRFPFLAKTPAWLKRLIQHYFWPITVSHITGLRSVESEEEIPGFVITIPMTANEMLKNRERAKKQIIRATTLARNKGSKIVGLGALTSSLSRGGLDLLGINGIAVTTGHAYTGYTVTQTLLKQLDNAQINYKEKNHTIAIVGAAGSVGSISAEILVHSGVESLLLIDIDRKMESVNNLKTQLLSLDQNLKIECSTNMGALKNALGVITATNAPDTLVKDKHISAGTIIVDDAQPSDISPELYDREDVLVLEAGAVHTPNISTNFNMGLANRNDNFCCLAEVLILASKKHVHNFVINRATLSDVEHIRKGGDELGFTLAKAQNEHGVIPKEKIQRVASLAQKR
ncbi:hypothetical protein CL644_02465 [bacterium]|nr:hypothetical protein [bacterium]